MQVRDQEMAALRRFGILSALQVPFVIGSRLAADAPTGRSERFAV